MDIQENVLFLTTEGEKTAFEFPMLVLGPFFHQTQQKCLGLVEKCSLWQRQKCGLDLKNDNLFNLFHL